MLILASVIADLTSFQIIGSTDALALVSTKSKEYEETPVSKDEVRVREFMKLQTERGKHGDLLAKRGEVCHIAERLAGKPR